MRICGIFIKQLSKEDTGNWNCEYFQDGRWVVHTTYLQVGPDPYERIGGFEPTKGFIQMSEIDLKPENLIKVLPALGSEYKVAFDLLITKVLRNNWLSVLMFTADMGLEVDVKNGDRIPAVFVWNDDLYIASSVNGDTNHHITVPTTVGEWMKIEICQHFINNQLTYFIRINRKTVHQVVQTQPCLYKRVKVFASQPTAAVKTVAGKIKNLYYETSDKENYGKCVVDFRPKPVAPSGVLQGPELVLKQNHLITVVPFIGREYSVSFEFYLNSYQDHDWNNILHFTRSANIHSYGDRHPAVWVAGNKDHYRLLHVASSVDGNRNMWINSQKIYPLRTWIPIEISQTLVSKKFIYKVVINGETVHQETNDVVSMMTDVKVYAGDPWYPAQDGKIRNLVLKTQDDSVCVCRANSC